MFIANAKQLASSFFDEPSIDAGNPPSPVSPSLFPTLLSSPSLSLSSSFLLPLPVLSTPSLLLLFWPVIHSYSAIAMTMMGQYWFNLTSDHVNASQYSSLGYSLAKHVCFIFPP